MKIAVKLADVDKRLDGRCVVMMNVRNSFLEPIEDFEGAVPIFLDFGSSSSFFNVVIQKSTPMKEIQMLMYHYDVQEREYAYVIPNKMVNTPPLKKLGQVFDLLPLVIDAVYVSKGIAYIDFRFHSTVCCDLSDILLSLVEDVGDFSIAYLGRSPGLVSILSEINPILPLSVVSYTIPADRHPALAPLCEMGEVLGELDNRSRTNLNLLLYSAEEAKNQAGVKTISQKDRIYYMEFSDKMLWRIRERAIKKGVLRLTYFFRCIGPLIRVDNIVLSSQKQGFISILREIYSEEPGSDISLDRISDLDGETFSHL